MNKLKFFFIASISAYSSLLLAVPDGFSELYQHQQKSVKLYNLDGIEKSSIILSVNYDSVKLPETSELNQSQLLLGEFFQRNSIAPVLQKKIIDALHNGVKNDEQCHGRYSDCIVTPNDFSFVYDFDRNELHLFVNPVYLETQASAESYASALNPNPALINHFNLFANNYSGQSDSYTISDQTVIGLPYGHMRSDINYSIDDRNNDEFDLYELAYDVEYKDKRLQVGHFRYGVDFNATDFLRTNSRFAETSLNIGSSPNLLLGPSNSYERLYFFSPASGELRIYRDDRLIVQRNITEGQSFITYDELPTGRYDIQLEVVVGGDVLLSEQRQIFNSSNEKLKMDEIDYVFSVGQFDESMAIYDIDDAGNTTESSNTLDNSFFYKGALAYRLYDDLVLGAGALGASGNYYGQFGLQAYLPYNSRSNIVASVFESGETHFEMFLNTGYLSLQYERFRNGEFADQLAMYMYGDASFDQFTLSSNYQFSTGQNSYFIYTFNETEDNNMFAGYDFWSATVGIYSPFIARSNLDFTVNYQSDNDEYSTSLTWTIPFSDTVSGKTLVRTDNDGVEQFSNSLSKDKLLPFTNTSSRIEVSNTYHNQVDDKVVADVAVSADTSQDKWRGNVYTYADSDSLVGFSGGISSSQVITKDADLRFTSVNSDAYLAVDVQNSEPEDNNGFLTLRRNGRLQTKSFLYDDNELYSLNDFESYNAYLDTESVSLLNRGEDTFNGFSYPGSVAKINAKLSRIVSFISAFSDISEDSIEDITCVGDGCMSIEKMMDGVFRISLMEGLPFELLAGENKCIVPKIYETATSLNFGHNYCLPDVNPISQITMLNKGLPVDLYYLGIFDNSADIESYLQVLEVNGAKIIKRQLGNNEAMYLQLADNQTALPDNHHNIMKEMMMLAKINIEMTSLNLTVSNHNTKESN